MAEDGWKRLKWARSRGLKVIGGGNGSNGCTTMSMLMFGCRDEDLHFKEIEVKKKVGVGLTRIIPFIRMHASCRTNSTHRASHTPRAPQPPPRDRSPSRPVIPHPEPYDKHSIRFLPLQCDAISYVSPILQSDHSMFAAPCRFPPQSHHLAKLLLAVSCISISAPCAMASSVTFTLP